MKPGPKPKRIVFLYKKGSLSTKCYICTSHSKNYQGYPRICIKGKTNLLSRYLWEKHFGKITKGLNVLHKCDNPACINISHLFLGTPKDNMQDKVSKGRDKENQVKGERNGQHKLTYKQVQLIRKLSSKGFNQKQLAERFDVGKTTISCIQRRKTWKDFY